MIIAKIFKKLTSGYPFDIKNANQWLANSKDNDNQMFKLSWSHYLILMRVENPRHCCGYSILIRPNEWKTLKKQQLQWAIQGKLVP